MTSSKSSNTSVKQFWDGRALNAELDKMQVTLPDINQRHLEIDMLLQYLPRGKRILDAGCGNGYSTAIFSQYAEFVLGVDYSESMIKRANKEFGHIENIEFDVQDVLALDVPEQSFDVAITQRCLINLSSWEDQVKAIENIAKSLKPEGVFFMQEGSYQGREQLNQAREAMGLERMPPVLYNLDFDEDKLWPFIRQHFEIVEVRYFGIYDFVSRIIHPLLVMPEEPQYDARVNEIAREAALTFRGMDDFGREFSAFLRRRI